MNFKDWLTAQGRSRRSFADEWMISYNTVGRLYAGKRVKRMIAKKIETITKRQVKVSHIPHQYPEKR